MNKYSIYKIHFNRLIIILSLMIFSSSVILAQKSEPYISQLTDLERAKDLFNKEKYAMALELFDSFVEESDNPAALETAEAEYMAVICAARLYNTDAEYRMNRFKAMHPDNPSVNSGWLELADNFYQAKNYRSARRYYDRVDRVEFRHG